MTAAFEAAARTWRELPPEARVAVWQYYAADGTPRPWVALFVAVGERVVGGVQVPKAARR